METLDSCSGKGTLATYSGSKLIASLWDWSTSSKKGVLKVDLPPGAKLKSGRFINELSATAVVMAEDSEPALTSSRNDSPSGSTQSKSACTSS